MSRDLNDILIFVNVVEQGSFTAAARRLGLPKTTVSRKVQELEGRLAARLINRTTRSLALTEAGTVFYEHASRIAADLDEAENAIHQLQGSPRGWLRVTAPYSLGVTMLSPMLVEFRQRYPEVRVDVVLSNERLDLVQHGIDVALRIGSLPDSSLVARRLGSDRTHVYAGSGYLARHGEPLVPEDLQYHHALVGSMHRRGQRFAWMLSDGQRTDEFAVQPVLVANDPYTLIALLEGDQGLMLASDLMLQCADHAPAARRVLAGWTGPDVELNAVFLGRRALAPKVRVFVDFVAEQIRSRCLFNTSAAAAVAPAPAPTTAQVERAAGL